MGFKCGSWKAMENKIILGSFASPNLRSREKLHTIKNILKDKWANLSHGKMCRVMIEVLEKSLSTLLVS